MDLNIWDIMAPAFFECLVLVGIHSYQIGRAHV